MKARGNFEEGKAALETWGGGRIIKL